MPIDIERDPIISLGQLARRLPPVNGTSTNISTAWRWTRKGIRGIVLETVEVGGKTCTTWQAYLDFSTAIGKAKRGEPVSTQTARMHKRVRNARQVLEAAGIN